MDSLDTQDQAISLAGVPFDQQWDILKPTIERLYVDEDLKLPDVIGIIRDQHGFNAA